MCVCVCLFLNGNRNKKSSAYKVLLYIQIVSSYQGTSGFNRTEDIIILIFLLFTSASDGGMSRRAGGSQEGLPPERPRASC